MKCSYLLLSAALVSAVLATPVTPAGHIRANKDEGDSPPLQDPESQLQAVARSSDDLQPRLAWLPLIPGVFAAHNIAEQRKARKERQRPKRDLDAMYDDRDLDDSAGHFSKRRQSVDSAIAARSDELQPRLAFLTLIPGLGALKVIKNMRHHRRDLEHEYGVDALVGRGGP